METILEVLQEINRFLGNSAAYPVINGLVLYDIFTAGSRISHQIGYDHIKRKRSEQRAIFDFLKAEIKPGAILLLEGPQDEPSFDRFRETYGSILDIVDATNVPWEFDDCLALREESLKLKREWHGFCETHRGFDSKFEKRQRQYSRKRRLIHSLREEYFAAVNLKKLRTYDTTFQIFGTEHLLSKVTAHRLEQANISSRLYLAPPELHCQSATPARPITTKSGGHFLFSLDRSG